MTRPTRWMRVLRGTLAASLATFVAAFSHVLGGGALPAAGALALALALSTLACIALAGRHLSLWRTASSVGLSQVLFHGLFSTVTGTAGTPMPAHLGHTSALVTLPAETATMSGHSGWMWLAHAAAGVITIVALRYAERAFFTVRDAALLFLGVLLGRVIPALPARMVRTVRIGCSREVLATDLSVLFSALRHRGPPALSAA